MHADLSPRPLAPASSSAAAAESVASDSDRSASADESEEFDEEEDNLLLAEGLSLSMHPGSAVNGALSALGGLEFWSNFDTELLRAWLHDYSLRRVPVSGRKPLVDQRTSRPRMLQLLVGRPDLYARPLAGMELSELRNNWRRFHPDAADDQVPGCSTNPTQRMPARRVERGAVALPMRGRARQERRPSRNERRLPRLVDWLLRKPEHRRRLHRRQSRPLRRLRPWPQRLLQRRPPRRRRRLHMPIRRPCRRLSVRSLRQLCR